MERAYTSKDIIQMAVQAKERGANLYLALARNSENYHVSRLFAEFAKDEQKHKRQLQKLMEGEESAGREEAYPGEKAFYLKALVDENTFKCDDAERRSLNRTISEDEALEAGISFEKDFMLFLHDLKQHSSQEAARTIDDLLKDEAKHLGEMYALKGKLKE